MNEQLKQLDEIRARYEAATPGPYTVCSSKYGTYLKDANGYPFLSIANNPKTGVNTDFIICSLNTVPKIREALAVAIEGLDKISTHGLGGNLIPPYGDAVDIAGQTKEQIQKILEDKA